MESYIIDACVGVKWFFNEDLSGVARNLLQRLERKEVKMIVPEIFYSEIANVFQKRAKKKMISEAAALKSFDVIMGFSLERYSDHELSDIALENALQFGISVYDAMYVSLAEVCVAPLVTADEALIKACKNRFDFILPLKDIT